jgi:hypothetical protein
MTALTTETRQDRLALAAEAGLPRLSLVAVVAGVLVAYGAFAVLAAAAGAVMKGVGVDAADVDLTDWNGRGLAVAVGALVLFLSWLFGGYVAGRLARRSGALHGLVTFVLGVAVAAAVGGAIAWVGGVDSLAHQLRTVGVPTSGSEWRDAASIAGAASLVAMLLGCLLGGALGERWFTKVARRAADPAIGAGARRYVADDDRAYRDRDEVVTGSGEYVGTDARDRTGEYADTETERDRERTGLLRRIRY